MKKLVHAGLFALTTAVLVTPAAIAAPSSHAHENNNHAQNMHPGNTHGQQHAEQRHHDMVQDRVLKPSRDWKAGQALPSHYYGKGYTVDHKRYKNLSKPGKNQRWIRVNGDYVLINTLNHSIVKIMSN